METIRFADGTVWNVVAVKAKVLAGTVDNDLLYGYVTADSLSGGAGDDTLYGAAGNDTLNGGAGADRLYGEDGDDVLQTGSQDDTLEGGSGNDSLQGQDGKDTLYGQAGNDTLDGGTGNDYLDGGAGNDIYRFGIGSGKDTINAYENTVGKLDVVRLGAGVLTTDLTARRDGTALMLSINGTSDALRINNYFNNDATGGYQLERITFADGTTWDVATIKNKVLAGTADNDLLYGYVTADNLSGGSGDDTLYGAAGNDTLNGGTGADRLYGENGDDVLQGGAGKDTLTGGSGNDVFRCNALSDTGSESTTWDVISDFAQGYDKIDLSALDADTATTTDDAFIGTLIGSTASFTAAGQLKLVSGILYGNTDADSTAEFAIQLTGGTALGASDFIL